jgi:hypothetical protein
VRDNKTGRDTYMKMGEVGVGLGVGIKDFRAVFVFHSPEVMQAWGLCDMAESSSST